jgi:acyl transferase domain-containing protein/NADPH:quinone reductase-like Zn-dependent oxidoreductase/SAM-dependent methyltransferase
LKLTAPEHVSAPQVQSLNSADQVFAAAGDRLEVTAIAAAFQRHKEGSTPLLIGSVKPNIGHLEAGAGMAGLIKTILSLESGVIPGNILYKNPNPRLGLAERNLRVVQEPTPWPTEGLRRASVNSFGYGGTNGHCIIDDAAHYLASRGVVGRSRTIKRPTTPGLSSPDSGFASESDNETKSEDAKYSLFVLSAPDQAALHRMAGVHVAHLQSEIDANAAGANELVEDLAYTYSNRRSAFKWRRAVVAQDTANLVEKLALDTNDTRSGKGTNLLFCFTGQGAQWFKMGRELLNYEVFKQSVADADSYLASIGSEWRVLTELTASKELSQINSPKLSQPLCTVLQVALVELLRHWNITPTSVVGHSSGEIAAAYACGALSAQDAWRTAFYRGKFAQEFGTRFPDKHGGMLAVGLSRSDVEKYIQRIECTKDQAIGVACVNSPESVTISGDADPLFRLEQLLKDNDVFARKLAVENAYHSKHMELLAEDYRQSLQDIKILEGSASVTMYSSVSGGAIQPSELDADYWVKNMVSPVLFDDAVRAIFTPTSGVRRRRGKARAISTVLEVGPHAALLGPVRHILQGIKKAEMVECLSVLKRNENAQATAVAAAGALWSAGVDVNLEHVNNFTKIAAPRLPLMNLPKYPWNHSTRYWHESALSKSLRFRHSPRTDLLGEPVREFTWSEPTWKNYIYVSELPWIADHSVRGRDIYPAAGMICAAIEAVKQCALPSKTIKSFDLRDVAIKRALIIPAEDPGIEVFTHLRPQRNGARRTSSWYDFSFSSLEVSTGPDRNYNEHCSGQVCIIYDDLSDMSRAEEVAANEADRAAFACAQRIATREVSGEKHYEAMSRLGINYGPMFRGLKAIKAGDGQATFDIEMCDTKSVMPANFEYPFVIHPTLLDAAIQSAYQGLTHDRNAQEEDTIVPTEFKRMKLSANMPQTAGTHLVGYVKSDWISTKDCTATIKLGLENWPETLVELGNCTFMGLADANNNSDTGYLDRRLATKHVFKPVFDLLTPSQPETRALLSRDVESPTSISRKKALSTKATFLYIKRAVRSLTPEVEASLEGHWLPYTEWLREKYEAGLKGELFGQRDATDDWTNMTAEQEEKFLYQALIENKDDFQLLAAVGNVLSEILAGTVQPLTVMLVDDMLTKFYVDAFGMTSGLYMYRNVFDLLGHQNPGMKILEVGAGTASVTVPILKVLGGKDGRAPRFGSYTFTDISSGWFAKAQETLKAWDGYIKFQKLDIEADDIFAQGYKPESFDIIAASNVLHATKRLDVTLNNCCKLLKPGGKMIIGELTSCLDLSGLIFGTLPGWWLSEDGRKGGPMISQEEWDLQLRQSGFSGLDIAAAAEDHEGTKMLSTMISTKLDKSGEAQLKHAIIVAPFVPSEAGDGITQAVIAKLTAQGVKTNVTSLSEAACLAEQDGLAAKNTATICLVEADIPIFARPTEDVFEHVRKIIIKSNTIFWYSCNSDANGVAPPDAYAISGLLRSARSENPVLRPYGIRLQARRGDFDIIAERVWQTATFLWGSTDESEYESEICEIDNTLTVPRLVDDEPLNKIIRSIGRTQEPELQPLVQPNRPLKMKMTKNTKIDSLHFVEDEDVAGVLPGDYVEVEVKANSINSADVSIASGKQAGLTLGVDGSGIICKVGATVNMLAIGDRVAFAAQNTFRNKVRLHKSLVQRFPTNMTFEEAAAIPYVYMAACQGVKYVAKLSKDEKVLITHASSSLGQAMIAITMSIGADVIVAAGSQERRDFLVKRFGFSPAHVLDSTSPALASVVTRITQGNGVDVVLDILGGEHVSNLCGCVAPFGRFVNFNKSDVEANAPICLRNFDQNVTFSSVNMDFILKRAPQRASQLLADVFSLLDNNTIKPHQPTVFNYSALAEAFAAAQESTIMDKIVLRLDETSIGNVVPFDIHPIDLPTNATYVLSGGMGGIGRAFACYLADNGARNIALLSRSAEITGSAVNTMEYLESLNVKVKVIACDVTEKTNVENALAEINRDMPPVRGVLQGAMVLRDCLYENMTYSRWMQCTRPKVDGTWNLHEVMPKHLDFFITLSSIAGIIGSPGQSNYDSANSYQDGICHYRRSLGLKAVTVDVGGVGGFGWLDENEGGSSFVKITSNLMIYPDELFTLLKSAITGYTSWGNECPTQLVTGIGSGGTSAAHVSSGGRDPYFWLEMQGRFAYLRKLDVSPTVALEKNAVAEFKKDLAEVKTMIDAGLVVQGAFTAKLAKSLMIAPEDIDTSLPTSTYGVDSLVAAELRNWCGQEIKAVVSVFDFLNAVPISTLALQIAENSALVPASVERTLRD